MSDPDFAGVRMQHHAVVFGKPSQTVAGIDFRALEAGSDLADGRSPLMGEKVRDDCFVQV